MADLALPPLLRLDGISVSYDAVEALKAVDLEIREGEIFTLLGSNGAGKTTLLKAISGLVPLTHGRIWLKDEKINGLPPHQIVRKRICQVPEGRGIFLNLSVEENLDLGAWTQARTKSELAQDLEGIFQLFPRLKERRKQSAGLLSGGEQQMLAVGRALMSRPKILLLDEPSLGLAPQMIEKIFEIIQKINQEGVTLLLVEQNALLALQVAHRGAVLETGKMALQGLAKELLHSDQVRQTYLGE